MRRYLSDSKARKQGYATDVPAIIEIPRKCGLLLYKHGNALPRICLLHAPLCFPSASPLMEG